MRILNKRLTFWDGNMICVKKNYIIPISSRLLFKMGNLVQGQDILSSQFILVKKKSGKLKISII